MLHSLLCIIFKILNCDTAVIAPSDDDNSSQYFHYHFYCLSSFHPVPPLSRWNLLSAILDFHLVLPRLVLPFDLNTKLLISQQPNIAQRPFVFKTNGKIPSITSNKQHCCSWFTSWVIKQQKSCNLNILKKTPNFGRKVRTLVYA